MVIDVNVDMGESFGRYQLGDDEGVMPFISSANVATGFHAGDPTTIERTVRCARQHGVAVGAHVGLPDRQGFGRREMAITPEELRTDTLYQLGALEAFLRVHDMRMQHVKPHGILYRMVSENERYIDTFLETVQRYDPRLFVMLAANTPAIERGRKLGLRMAPEVLIDLGYDDQGNWVLERTKQARAPEEVAERALLAARERKVRTVSGNLIEVQGVTLCVHGDSPNAVAVVRAIRARFEAEGILIGGLERAGA